MDLALEKDVPAIRSALERVGFEGLHIDTSYGFVTGIAFAQGSGIVTISTRTDEHPRGRGKPIDDWVLAALAFKPEAH